MSFRAMRIGAFLAALVVGTAPAIAEDSLTDPNGVPLINWLTTAVVSPASGTVEPAGAKPAAAAQKTSAVKATTTAAPAKAKTAAKPKPRADSQVASASATYRPSWFSTWGDVSNRAANTSAATAAKPAAAPAPRPAPRAAPVAATRPVGPSSPAPAAMPPSLFTWVFGGTAGAAPSAPGQSFGRTVAPRLDPRFARKEVTYKSDFGPGTIVVDTAGHRLYHIKADGKAMRYSIGVGRQGFTWKGKASIQRKAKWPTWHPPAEMRKREPWLPVRMEGGPENPLGARALYLYEGGVDTLYRIHGTNQPETIGQSVSSGCIRLINDDIEHLYQNVKIGARVVVL